MTPSRRPAGRMPGFTLIEMLISLAIFSVVTGFTVANFRRGGQSDELRLAADNVASAIRKAQTFALSGETAYVCSTTLAICNPNVGGSCAGGSCGKTLPKGFGIHLSSASGDAHTMAFFADTDGDRLYDAGETISSQGVSPTPNVSVSFLAPISGSVLDIVFVPPKPRTYFNDAAADAVATVTLQLRGTGQAKSVKVNKVSGQISVE
ncbi:prepilin-type N-terminal cleavage/methylation domain-containing protein [Candidatus Uhrbacteria bacterium]|nr:prepilin-type N-terminal cleavage/methylation domain-containing protein [Candidatus Uhrbacteria bacterium]